MDAPVWFLLVACTTFVFATFGFIGWTAVKAVKILESRMAASERMHEAELDIERKKVKASEGIRKAELDIEREKVKVLKDELELTVPDSLALFG